MDKSALRLYTDTENHTHQTENISGHAGDIIRKSLCLRSWLNEKMDQKVSFISLLSQITDDTFLFSARSIQIPPPEARYTSTGHRQTSVLWSGLK